MENKNNILNSVVNGDSLVLLPNWNDEELKYIVCEKLKFDESVFNLLLSFQMDVESLETISEQDLNEIFPSTNMGLRVKFKSRLFAWRKSKASTIPASNSFCEMWVQSHSNSLSPTLSPPSGSVNRIKDILGTTFDGSEILNYYERNKVLRNEHRDVLINKIVQRFIDANKAMTMKDIISYTDAIVEEFPSENKDFYYKKRAHGQNPIGKLHDKAVNSRRKIKRDLTFKKPFPITETIASTSTSAEQNLSSTNENLCIISTEEQNQIWLKYNSDPWDIVQKKWTDVWSLRRSDILKNQPENVFQEWPLFKHSLGHLLIDIDYKLLQKEPDELLTEKWVSFLKKIVSYFGGNIRDSRSIALFKKLQNYTICDSNCRDCVTMLLLHAVLKPPGSIQFTDRATKLKRKWKPSIQDSQESMVIFISNVKDYEKTVFDLQSKYHSKNLTLQPLILAIGDINTSVKEFFVIVNGTRYKFSKFLNAFDILFKSFYVFNLKHPCESENVYKFIEKYFYNLNENGIYNPNITSLFEFLKNER